MDNTFPRVRELTRTVGTRDFSLDIGSADGYRRIGEVYNHNDTVHYRIDHEDLNEWEEGTGTFTDAAGVRTLVRTTVTASSNSDAKVDFSPGDKVIKVNPRLIVPQYGSDPSGLPDGSLVIVSDTLKQVSGGTATAVGGGDANPTQVSSGEITAGTETALRSFSVADLVAIVAAHGGGGGASDRLTVTLADCENTTDETVIVSATVPADTWTDGDIYRLTAVLQTRNDGQSNECAVKVRGGGGVVTVTSGIYMDDQSGGPFTFSAAFDLVRVGADIIVTYAGGLYMDYGNNGSPIQGFEEMQNGEFPDLIYGTIVGATFDSDQDIELRFKFETAGANAYVNAVGGSIRRV